MFFLKRQRKTIDDRPENLEELRNSIKPFCLVDKLEEDVVYRASDVGPEVQEFSVDSMERSLEEIPFAGIFRVKQFKKLMDQSSHL